jgi:hypothetical protein
MTLPKSCGSVKLIYKGALSADPASVLTIVGLWNPIAWPSRLEAEASWRPKKSYFV